MPERSTARLDHDLGEGERIDPTQAALVGGGDRRANAADDDDIGGHDEPLLVGGAGFATPTI